METVEDVEEDVMDARAVSPKLIIKTSHNTTTPISFQIHKSVCWS